jgi:hypothetical protein
MACIHGQLLVGHSSYGLPDYSHLGKKFRIYFFRSMFERQPSMIYIFIAFLGLHLG